MRLKSWFCFQPFERLKQQRDRHAHAEEQRDSKHEFVQGSSWGLRSVAMSPGPEHTAQMVLCQAIVDASPEPVSIYDFTTGRMVLCNSACRDLPGGCVSLTTLFALDPASLQDALSRVRAGQCWRGLIQLPAVARSHLSLADSRAPLLPATRPATSTGALASLNSPLPRLDGLGDSTSPHSISHAPSSAMLRQALQLVAYPSLRLHGSPATATGVVAPSSVHDDLAAATCAPPCLMGQSPADLASPWRAGGGRTLTAATAGVAVDTIAKATRAAALAKAAAAAAAAVAAAEAAAGATAAGRARALGSVPSTSPSAPMLPAPTEEPVPPTRQLARRECVSPVLAASRSDGGDGGRSEAAALAAALQAGEPNRTIICGGVGGDEKGDTRGEDGAWRHVHAKVVETLNSSLSGPQAAASPDARPDRTGSGWGVIAAGQSVTAAAANDVLRQLEEAYQSMLSEPHVYDDAELQPGSVIMRAYRSVDVETVTQKPPATVATTPTSVTAVAATTPSSRPLSDTGMPSLRLPLAPVAALPDGRTGCAAPVGASADAGRAQMAARTSGNWLDRVEEWRLVNTLSAGGGGASNSGDGAAGVSAGAAAAAAAAALYGSPNMLAPVAHSPTLKAPPPPPLPQPAVPSHNRRSGGLLTVQPVPAQPHSLHLLEALNTSTWGARMSGRIRRPMRRAATCATLPNDPVGGCTEVADSAATHVGSMAASSVGDGVDQGSAGGCGVEAAVRCLAALRTPDYSAAGRFFPGTSLAGFSSSPRSEGLPAYARPPYRQSAFAALAVGAAGAAGCLAALQQAGGVSVGVERHSSSGAGWASATSALYDNAASSLPGSDQALSTLGPRTGLLRSGGGGGGGGGAAAAAAATQGLLGPELTSLFAAQDASGGSHCGHGGSGSSLQGGVHNGLALTGGPPGRAGTSAPRPVSPSFVATASLEMNRAAPRLVGQLHQGTQLPGCSHTVLAEAAGSAAAAPPPPPPLPPLPPGLPINRMFQLDDEAESRFRRGVSCGLVPEAASLRAALATQSDTEDGVAASGGILICGASRPGSSSSAGRTGSPVGAGVLPRMLDLATKVSTRALRTRASASRLGQSPGGGGVLIGLAAGVQAGSAGIGGGDGSGGGGGSGVLIGGAGAASELGSGPSIVAADSGPGTGGLGAAGGSNSSGPVSPAMVMGRAGSFSAGGQPGLAVHSARQPSFSRFWQRGDTASVALETIRSSRGSSRNDGGGGGGADGQRSISSGRAASGGKLDPPADERVAVASGPVAKSGMEVEGPRAGGAPTKEAADSGGGTARKAGGRHADSAAARLKLAGAAGAPGARLSYDAGGAGGFMAGGAGSPFGRAGGQAQLGPAAGADATAAAAGALASGCSLPTVHEASCGPLEGLALLPSGPHQAGSISPTANAAAAAAAGGGAVGGGGCPDMEVWHEVVVSGLQHPTTGEQLIMVTQHDVSARVWAEQQLARVMEAEHALLEAIFPAHVLEHIAIMAAACSDAVVGDDMEVDTETETAGRPRLGVLPQRPTLKGLTEAAYAEAEAAGLAASGLGPAAGFLSAGQPALPITGDTFLHLATSHSALTVLFCDIQGFTTMCNSVKPATVMAFLNDLYTRLDAMLDAFGVYKVETIGDCYVAAGGLMKVDEDTGAVTVRSDDVDPQHANRTVQFAKALLRAGSAVRLPTTGEPVRLRVGIHSGPAMSGVVGTRMPRFCLFGDTINTASRMESTGVPGAIHVSQATRDLAPGEDWEPTGGVEAKGKGLLQTYLLKPPLEPW